MGTYKEFKSECENEIVEMGLDSELKRKSIEWMVAASKFKYSYHFEWLGRPVIQFPQDIVALQEIIWRSKPDLIIETGIAHGGSLILNASILALLDLIDHEAGVARKNARKVLGIDIDIREHNLEAILKHPLGNRIQMIQGSSTSAEILSEITPIANSFERVMVILDSNHTHDHVLGELNLYSKRVTSGQYLVVFDTVIENFPDGSFPQREWGIGNNPLTAVQDFLKSNSNFMVDREIENKLLITVAPNGFLLKV